MASKHRGLRLFTPKMMEILLRLYRAHGVLRVKSLRRLDDFGFEILKNSKAKIKSI